MLNLLLSIDFFLDTPQVFLRLSNELVFLAGDFIQPSLFLLEGFVFMVLLNFGRQEGLLVQDLLFDFFFEKKFLLELSVQLLLSVLLLVDFLQLLPILDIIQSLQLLSFLSLLKYSGFQQVLLRSDLCFYLEQVVLSLFFLLPLLLPLLLQLLTQYLHVVVVHVCLSLLLFKDSGIFFEDLRAEGFVHV